jgi:hypothetical protein
MADAQTLNGIAALLQGFNQGYGRAKESAGNAEEQKVRARYMQAQSDAMQKEQMMKQLSPEDSNFFRTNAGAPASENPLSVSGAGLYASIGNTNARLKYSKMPKSQQDQMSKLWVSGLNELKREKRTAEAKLLELRARVTNIMTDPNERKSFQDELVKYENGIIPQLDHEIEKQYFIGQQMEIPLASTQEWDQQFDALGSTMKNGAPEIGISPQPKPIGVPSPVTSTPTPGSQPSFMQGLGGIFGKKNFGAQ